MDQGKFRTTLIVVDMQNAYCHEQGSLARQGFDISACRNVIGNVKKTLETFRKETLPVIFLYLAFEKDYRDGGAMVHEIWLFSRRRMAFSTGPGMPRSSMN